MSIASRITEMETHINNAYTSIDNLGIDISNTNKNIYNISTLLDTFYESLPKVSGIGASLSLSPTMVGKIKLNEIQGNTLQDSQPTPDTPVEIQSVTGLQNVNVTGKNLLNLGTKSITTYYQESNLYIPAGTYTMSAKITSDDTQYTQSRAYLYNGNTLVAMFTLSRNIRSSETKTLSASADRIIIYSSIDYSNSNGKNATWEDIQLEQGSATSYEPYKCNTYEVNLGKNLWGISNQTTTKNNVDITIQDGEITLNGTASSDGLIMFNPIDETILNGDYTLNEIYVSGTYTGNASNINVRKKGTAVNIKSLNYAASNTNTTLNVSNTSIIFGIYLTNGSSFTNFKFKPQLVKGTSADYDFSPYFTPIELNKIGDYQDSIKKSTGKNLFDKDNYTIKENTATWTPIETGGIFSNTGTWGNGVAWRYKLDTTKAYTLKANGFSNNVFCYIRTYTDNTYSTTKTSILNDGSGNIIKTFTPDSEYVAILFRNSQPTSNVEITNIQLEENSQATSYEPYGKVWYIEKQIGKVVLNGSETYNNSGTTTSGNYRISYTGLANIILRPSSAGTVGNILCSHFVARTENETYRCNQGISVEINGNISIYDNSNTSGNTTTFKTWLASNNMTIKYALATPTYTEITNEELIEDLETLYTAKSQEGTTNISITSEDLEMILNVSALKGDVE